MSYKTGHYQINPHTFYIVGEISPLLYSLQQHGSRTVTISSMITAVVLVRYFIFIE